MHRRSLFSLGASAALLLAVPFAAACGGNDENAGFDDDGRPIVVATTSQIGALTKEVGGDQIALTILIGPGVDPHDYEMTAQDRRRVDESLVILRNGVGLDEFLDSVLEDGDNEEKVVTVSDGIEIREGEHHDGEEEEDGHDHSHDEGDPHIWQSVPNNKVIVENIVEALATADPDNADTYRANGAAYQQVLDDTDAEIRSLIDEIPEENRKVVTNHDSIGYFIDEYGLTFVGAVIPSTSSSAEPSAQDLAALVELIESENVRAIFADSAVDPKVAEQIAADTGVTIVDDLYGDSLGEPGSGAETVHGMLLANARTIAEALK